jgi:large-conductance mechanosensitive channel
MSSSGKRPFALYVLVFLLFFQGVSALYGGISLIADPTGGLLKMEQGLLAGSIFTSYLIPGLILSLLLGIVPMILIYPLLARPHWKWARILNIYKNRYWAWTYSLYLGLGIIIWIDVQIYMIGYSQFIQTFIAFLGVLIVIFTLWPSVMKYFRRSRQEGSDR